jgi:hypothetical protein
VNWLYVSAENREAIISANVYIKYKNWKIQKLPYHIHKERDFIFLQYKILVKSFYLNNIFRLRKFLVKSRCRVI